MADKKITDLQLISALSDSLSVPGDDGLQTYRFTGTQLKAYVNPPAVNNTLKGNVAGTTATPIDLTATQVLAMLGLPAKNHLVNSAFDYWQVGTSVTVANATKSYLADQWYVKNSLGTNGVITQDQVTGVTNGSKYGLRVKITTAPTAAQANGCELYQPLSNLASIPLYGATACFNVLVKALGNVTQVGIQFYYATTEVALTNAIGSEVLTTVNTSTFSLASIVAQALGTTQTTAGIVGVRIRITAVSSGNTYDLNNGFTVEQAMLATGSVAPPFSRQFSNPVEELLSCNYFLWEFFNGTAGNGVYVCVGVVTAQNATGSFAVPLPCAMRIAPVGGVSAGTHFNVANAANNAATTSFSSGACGARILAFTMGIGTFVANSGLVMFANTASARLYADARIV